MSVRRHRRYSVEFKLQLIREYLSGEGSLKGIANRHDINHSVLIFWLKKHQRGELTDDDHLADQVHEYEAQISALERKVGQLTMELDALKRGCALSRRRQARRCRSSPGRRSLRRQRMPAHETRAQQLLPARQGQRRGAPRRRRSVARPDRGDRRGVPRVRLPPDHHELRRRGTVANHKRVARLMREGHVAPTRVRRFVATTDSAHDAPVFSNLTRTLAVTGPNQLWYADLTYIRLKTRFVFLAVLLDAWSRKVVGYAISHLLDARLPLAALDAALAHRRPGPGLIHHSDRGVQYTSRAYRDRLAQHGVRGSMGRRGNPYDNATVESFMKTLKYEEVYPREYATVHDVIQRLPRFIEELYNRRRLHSSLGYRPPEEFETLHPQPAA